MINESYVHVYQLLERFNGWDAIKRAEAVKYSKNLNIMGDKLVLQGHIDSAYVRYFEAICNKPDSLTFLKEGEAQLLYLYSSIKELYTQNYKDQNDNILPNNAYLYSISVFSYCSAFVKKQYFNDNTLSNKDIKYLNEKIHCFEDYFNCHGKDENTSISFDFFQCVEMPPHLEELIINELNTNS